MRRRERPHGTPYEHAERAARRLSNQHPHPDPCKSFDAVLAVVLEAIGAAVEEAKDGLLKPGRN